MKKVYVVVEDTSADGVNYPQTPTVFADKDNALAFFDKRWKEKLCDIKEEMEEWGIDEYEGYKEFYAVNGNPCEDYYRITLHELEVL